MVERGTLRVLVTLFVRPGRSTQQSMHVGCLKGEAAKRVAKQLVSGAGVGGDELGSVKRLLGERVRVDGSGEGGGVGARACVRAPTLS